jgi:hypothetical protein
LRKNEKAIESCLAKGRTPPDWYLEEPTIHAMEGFYLRAFWELSTERHFGQILGPIPWSRVLEYAFWTGLDADMIDPFVQIIRALDSGFLEYMRGEHDKESSRLRREAKQRVTRPDMPKRRRANVPRG